MPERPAQPRPSRPSTFADAIDQARKEERVLARLEGHDQDLRDLRQNMGVLSHSVEELKSQLTRLERMMNEAAAVARAVAAAAEKAASSSLSARQYYTGVALVLIALVGLFIGHGKV